MSSQHANICLFLLLSFLASITFLVVPVYATGITRVNQEPRSTSTTSTITVTCNATPTSGNCLIAVIGTDGLSNATATTVSAITETNVAWTRQTGISNSTVSIQDCEIWFGVVSASASTSITIALSGTPSNGAVADMCEYSGILTSGFLDQTATHQAAVPGSPYSVVTGTTSTTGYGDELWIGGIVCVNRAMNTPANGFTLIDGALYAYASTSYLEKIVSTTGKASSGVNLASSSGYWTMGCIATFIGVSNFPSTTLNKGVVLGVAGFIMGLTVSASFVVHRRKKLRETEEKEDQE